MPCAHLTKGRNQSSWNHPPLRSTRQDTHSIMAKAAGPRPHQATRSFSAVRRWKKMLERSYLAQQHFTSTKKPQITELQLSHKQRTPLPKPRPARSPPTTSPFALSCLPAPAAPTQTATPLYEVADAFFPSIQSLRAFLSFFPLQKQNTRYWPQHSTASFNLRRAEQFKTAPYRPRQFWQPLLWLQNARIPSHYRACP